MTNIHTELNCELAEWAHAFREDRNNAVVSRWRDGVIYGCIGCIHRLLESDDWMLPPEDDRLTVESFFIGRFDDDYLKAVRRGVVLNYAAWLRYQAELKELETVGADEWTDSKGLRIIDLTEHLWLRNS